MSPDMLVFLRAKHPYTLKQAHQFHSGFSVRRWNKSRYKQTRYLVSPNPHVSPRAMHLYIPERSVYLSLFIGRKFMYCGGGGVEIVYGIHSRCALVWIKHVCVPNSYACTNSWEINNFVFIHGTLRVAEVTGGVFCIVYQAHHDLLSQM